MQPTAAAPPPLCMPPLRRRLQHRAQHNRVLCMCPQTFALSHTSQCSHHHPEISDPRIFNDACLKHEQSEPKITYFTGIQTVTHIFRRRVVVSRSRLLLLLLLQYRLFCRICLLVSFRVLLDIRAALGVL